MKPPVVLLGGHGSTLSVARSLGRAGVDVHVLGDEYALPRFSRYCKSFVDLGAGAGVQERWLTWLQEGPRGAVLLSCQDDGVELVARNRTALTELGYIPFEADDEVVLAMLDKERTYALARRAGVPCPRTWPVATRDDLEQALGELRYPCALKPRFSHLFVRHFGRTKLMMARDEDELLRALDQTLALGLEMIVTEVVAGPDDQQFGYYTYLDEHGTPLMQMTKQKLRQFPPGYGLGCYHVTDWNPEVAELGLRFLRSAGVLGLANPEFKRDERDGQLKLLEVNHRFTAINELLLAAGIDVALLTYRRLTGRSLPPEQDYRRGLHIWFPVDDTRALLAYRRRGELSLGAWLRSLAHRQRPAVYSTDDPMPSLTSFPFRIRRWVRGRTARPDGNES